MKRSSASHWGEAVSIAAKPGVALRNLVARGKGMEWWEQAESG